MNLFYDIRPVYPYICISGINEEKIQEFIKYLKERNIVVTKFYEKPKYPASDGITYDYLLRINFEHTDKRIKPEVSKINSIFSDFIKQNEKVETKEDNSELIENERKYFKQIRTFLNSERKIFDLDRQFFKEQLEKLNVITNNLKTENSRVAKFIENYNDKVTNEIRNIINNKSFDNQDIKNLEIKLSEKENSLKEKENELSKREQDLDIIKQDYNDYREKLDKQYQSLVNEIRNISLGIDNSDETDDSIQELKILIFGESNLNSTEIYEIFNEIFFQTFGEDLSKKCLEADLLDYRSIKNSNINKKIKQDKYDYIIVGQHDHSTKGKNSKQSYVNFIKENGLKAMVSEDYNNKLNESKLKELAKYIINDWEQQFEIIE